MAIKIREKPYMSANKLAEYIDAGAPRRKQIIYTLKYVDEDRFRAHWYAEAKSALAAYLASDDPSVIDAAFAALKGKAGGSDYAAKLADASINALDVFLENVESHAPDLSGCDLSAYREPWKDVPKLDIAGVEVSVAPEVLVKKGGKVGFLKLHVVKEHTLTERSGPSAALLLHMFATEHFAGEGEANHKLCYVFDVFNPLPVGRVYQAPRATKRRLAELGAACEEIRDRWQTI